MVAGAIAGYAIQVGDNLSKGMDLGAALTTNISAEKVVGGAVIAGGIVLGAAVVSAGIAAFGGVGAAACADGDCTNEVVAAGKTVASTLGKNNTTTLYRFANGAEDMVSNLSKATDPLLKAEYEAYYNSMSASELAIQAEIHATGNTNLSPFISTFRDVQAGVNTTDPWLQNIIKGTSYLYEMQVPNNLLLVPTNELSQLETEILIKASSAMPYVTQVINNPYLER
jgi:hypothetical protein